MEERLKYSKYEVRWEDRERKRKKIEINKMGSINPKGQTGYAGSTCCNTAERLSFAGGPPSHDATVPQQPGPSLPVTVGGPLIDAGSGMEAGSSMSWGALWAVGSTRVGAALSAIARLGLQTFKGAAGMDSKGGWRQCRRSEMQAGQR